MLIELRRCGFDTDAVYAPMPTMLACHYFLPAPLDAAAIFFAAAI